MTVRVVVLGTGTDVGKTYVSCALLGEWARRGEDVVGLKPVESGGDEGAGDQARLNAALQYNDARLFHVKHARFRFEAPISPHLAARELGIEITVDAIEEWVAHHARPTTLIETAGGACSPLSRTATNLDLVRALRPSYVLLVAPDRIGVLHDVAATLAAARCAGLHVHGIALSAPARPDASTGRNAAELNWLGLGSPVAEFPRCHFGTPSASSAAKRAVDAIVVASPVSARAAR